MKKWGGLWGKTRVLRGGGYGKDEEIEGERRWKRGRRNKGRGKLGRKKSGRMVGVCGGKRKDGRSLWWEEEGW